MKVSTPIFSKRHRILLLTMIGILFASCITSHAQPRASKALPAFVIGVHHLGPDYLINRFYINKSIGDNVGEEGGGGGHVCCVMLSRTWQPASAVDVRWEVYHIIRSKDPKVPETAEVEGIYQAQVPVEKYAEPGDFYVHFFPNGRVRTVVSPISSDSDAHPVRWGDANAGRIATAGKAIPDFFTAEELAELQRKIIQERKEYGDWR